MILTVFSGCADKKSDSLLQKPSDTEITTAIDNEDEKPADTTVDDTNEDVTADAAVSDDVTAPEVTEAQITTALTASAKTTAEETSAVSTQATVTVTTAELVTTVQPETTISYSLTPMSEVMYAKDDVNVREGPDSAYTRLGHLDRGDRVNVTGLSDSGWYQIDFKGGKGFVSGKYLSKDKPAEVTTAAAAEPKVDDKPETKPSKEDNKDSMDVMTEKTKWIAAWSTAMLTAGDNETPKNPSLSQNTVRQQIRVSYGGEKLKLVLSNEYGKSDLVIESIMISKHGKVSKPDTDLGTQKSLTYNGKKKITIPAGKKITTDELDFEFSALEDLTITMKLGSVPSVITSHTASRCTTWVIKGNHVSDNSYSGAGEMTSWYFINELQTLAEEDAGVIVCIGDSITDGASINANTFARYSDNLMRLARKDSSFDKLAVAAKGIGGNAVFGGLGTAFKDRFDRDVLQVPGVKYCVMMIGINDIGYAQSDVSSSIIEQYKIFIDKCHKNGIKIYALTITPCKGNGYYSELHESIRQKVNKFIKSKDSGFDGYIDTASALASKNDAEKLDSLYASNTWNDSLHLSASGYNQMGKLVYEAFKEFIK